MNSDGSKKMTYVVPVDGLYKVKIINEKLDIDTASGKINAASPGDVTFELLAKGSEIVLDPASALILITNGLKPLVLKPELGFTSPSQNDTVVLGATTTIRWDASAVTDPQMFINLNKGNVYVSTISPLLNVYSRQFEWKIPTNLATGTYSLSIGTNGTQKLFAASPTFSVDTVAAKPAITISSPTLNQVAVTGSSTKISWTTKSVTDTEMVINLNKGNSYLTTLASNVPVFNKTYTWNLPENLVTGTDYYISFGTTGNQNLYAVSQRFTINNSSTGQPVTLPKITITSPTEKQNANIVISNC